MLLSHCCNHSPWFEIDEDYYTGICGKCQTHSEFYDDMPVDIDSRFTIEQLQIIDSIMEESEENDEQD